MVPAVAAVAATAALVAAGLRLEGTAFLLGAYLVGWAECVVLAEGLSPLAAIGRIGYASGEAALLIAAVVYWRARGAPRPGLPELRPGALRRNPLLLALAVVVVCALAYEGFIAFTTPPDNTDALTYHLSRAAEWLSRGSLGYFPATSARENAFPLNAEIGVLFTFVFAGRDTFAALPQFVGQLAILVGVYGCARRLGFGGAAALFASLLTATLSEISLEAVTAQNDLVVASFVVAAAFFILRGDRTEVAPAGLAIGLAIGTKLTALLALPILALLAIAVVPRRRLLRLGAAAVIGLVLVGAWSYVDNLTHTGHLLGEVPEDAVFVPTVSVLGTIATVARVYDRFIEFPGLPLSSVAAEHVADAGRFVFTSLGIPAEAPGSTFRDSFSFWPNTGVDEDSTYFGVLGALLVVPLSLGFTVAALRRRSAPLLVLGLALPLFATALALANSFNPWLGRFMVVPVVLTMPLAAWLYERRMVVVAAAYAVIGAVGLGYTQAYSLSKPTGLVAGTRPVWTLSRVEAETLWAPAMAPVIRAVDRDVPASAVVGTVLGPATMTYPLYGATLTRSLVALPPPRPLAAATEQGLRWVVIDATGRLAAPQPGWAITTLPSGWRLAHRERA